MKCRYAIAQKVWGEFNGELYRGEFSVEAGTSVAADAANEELLEHLVGLGLAEREPARRPQANSRKREV